MNEIIEKIEDKLRNIRIAGVTDFFSRHKVRTQMMIFHLIVMLPMFFGSIYLLAGMKDIVRENSTTESLNNADRIRIRINDLVYITENISDMICSNYDIITFLSTEFDDPSDIYSFYVTNNFISDYTTIFPQIRNVRIYLDRNNFVFNNTFRHADREIRQQAWFKECFSEASSIRWRVIHDHYDGEFYLSCVRPLYDSMGRVLGVAVVEISPEWINEYLSDSGYYTVFSVNNGVVFYSNISAASPGKIITSDEADLYGIDRREVLEAGFMGSGKLTVFEAFQCGDSNSIFQIFLINPNNTVNERTTTLYMNYIGYIMLLLCLSLLIIVLFTNVFANRIMMLRDRMHSVSRGDFGAQLELSGSDEVSDLNRDLSVMVNSMQKLMNENYEARIQAEAFKFDQMEAEFKALASQINPHFLYNTLETIRMKAYCNNDKETAALVKKLGKFMRRCLEVKSDTVTLKSELEFTTSYLELQAARFGERVSYSVNSEVDGDYMVLPLIIQPLTENAFVHGIESSKENGMIKIHVYYCGEQVYIDVTDNGKGITPERLAEVNEKLRISDTSSGKSIGLTNVNKRVKMYFGKEYGLSIRSNPGYGTEIRVILPRFPETKITERT